MPGMYYDGEDYLYTSETTTDMESRIRGTGELETAVSNLTGEYQRRYTVATAVTVPQPPFSLSIRGVIFRDRPVPYVVSLSGVDPDTVIDD